MQTNSVPDDLMALVARIGSRLVARSQTVTTAESCTGGLIAAALTEVGGSSAWFERGFVTYSNQAKSEMLDVPAAFIEGLGAVSEPVVAAMAQGACERAGAQWGIAVSGIAGPSGGTPEKPVGTVWLAWATPGGIVTECRHFAGERSAIRAQTVAHALAKLDELLGSVR